MQGDSESSEPFSVGPKGVELFLGEEKPDLNAGHHSTLPTASWHALLVLNANFNVSKVRPIAPLPRLLVGLDCLFLSLCLSMDITGYHSSLVSSHYRP
jgi:hypothetical protein